MNNTTKTFNATSWSNEENERWVINQKKQMIRSDKQKIIECKRTNNTQHIPYLTERIKRNEQLLVDMENTLHLTQ